MYSFHFDKLPCGSKRRISSGTIIVRKDATDVEVHMDTLYDASGLYRRLVEDTDSEVPVLDITGSNLELVQLDFFLCMAYQRPWVFTRDTTLDDYIAMVRALAYFDAADHAYVAAQHSATKPPWKFNDEFCDLLKLLVELDPVKSKMPYWHAVCIDEMIDLNPYFIVSEADIERLEALTKPTLISILCDYSKYIHKYRNKNCKIVSEADIEGMTKSTLITMMRELPRR